MIIKKYMLYYIILNYIILKFNILYHIYIYISISYQHQPQLSTASATWHSIFAQPRCSCEAFHRATAANRNRDPHRGR